MKPGNLVIHEMGIFRVDSLSKSADDSVLVKCRQLLGPDYRTPSKSKAEFGFYTRDLRLLNRQALDQMRQEYETKITRLGVFLEDYITNKENR